MSLSDSSSEGSFNSEDSQANLAEVEDVPGAPNEDIVQNHLT